MAEPDKFDPVAASQSLPDLPAPLQQQGSGMMDLPLGAARLRCVSDGAMSLPFQVMAPGAPMAELLALTGLQAAPILARGEMTAALIETGLAQVLVDPGAGPHWQAGAGFLGQHMAINAIAPETVTHLVLTHLHPDHAWGALTSAGHPAFPNARVYVGRAEARFWSKPGLADRVQPGFRDTVLGAQKVLERLADRIVEVQEGDEIVPGLSVLDTPGHSPGHISLFLNEGEGLILTGDAVVNDVISFQRPDWPFGFDTDPEAAVMARRRLLQMGARGGHMMAGFHWSWPGFGHAETQGTGFRFLPKRSA